MNKISIKTVLLAITAPAAVLAAQPAAAADFGGFGASHSVMTGAADSAQHRDRGRHRGHDRHYNSYGNGGSYGEPIYANTRTWRGDDGRYYCRRSNGTTGLIIGGAAGALLGREIDSRGERGTGTILGALGGALLGRELQRSNARCR